MADEPAPAATPDSQAAPQRTRAQELLDKLWTDGKLGAEVRAKAKELYPDVRIPEDDINPVLAPALAELQAARDELKAERESIAKERSDAADAATKLNLESQLDAARNRFNLTDDGFDKMVARMKETGNYTDAEAAAAWVAQQTPPPKAPANYLGPQALNFAGSAEQDERFKLLHTDPGGKFLDKEFNDFFADPDKYVQETFAA